MKPPLPVLTCLVLPDLFFALLIATRPPFFLRLLGSLVLVYLTYYTTATYTTGTVGGDLGLGGALGSQPFSVLLLLWLTDPMREFTYVYDGHSSLAKKPFGVRLYESLCILRNPRLIGLNVQLPTPKPFQGSRGQFIRARFLQILQCILLIDLGQSFIHTHPEFFLQGTSSFPNGLRGYLMHFACQLSWLMCGYAALKLLYTSTALTCVLFGPSLGLTVGRPELWPDMFGKWSDAYTVRRTWGRVWHQNLRRYYSFFGSYPRSSSSPRPRNSFIFSQMQVWIAFTCTGIIHCFGDLMVGRQYVGASLPFFLMNAGAVTFEDSVIAVAAKVNLIKRFTKISHLIGYLWVLVWFSYALPKFYLWTFEPGLGNEEMLPFSIVRAVLPYLPL